MHRWNGQSQSLVIPKASLWFGAFCGGVNGWGFVRQGSGTVKNVWRKVSYLSNSSSQCSGILRLDHCEDLIFSKNVHMRKGEGKEFPQYVWSKDVCIITSCSLGFFTQAP